MSSYSTGAFGSRRGSKEPGRLGLGLYFTKKILQEQGGDISYEPKDNGSNFVVTLPGNWGRGSEGSVEGDEPSLGGLGHPCLFQIAHDDQDVALRLEIGLCHP